MDRHALRPLLHLRRSTHQHRPPTPPWSRLARLEAMSGFDRARPLWQFTLVEQLIGGRAALIMKVHHSLTDGIGACSSPPLVRDDRGPRPGRAGHRPEGRARSEHGACGAGVAALRRPPGTRGTAPRRHRSGARRRTNGARSGWGARRRPGHRPLRRTVRPAGLGHALEPDDRPGPRPSSRHARRRSRGHAAGSPFGRGHPERRLRRLGDGGAPPLPRASPRQGGGPAHHLAHLHPQG